MASRGHPHPVIPDHEVLRKIGGGSYGEVWLARGVTGALRAVKVVRREDFEDERGFEREFEGILKFEPMSRDHPALVNILHVGRSPDGTSFYYYVMELGDDVTTGQEINPIEYEPRTLRADHQLAAGVQWETNECIDVGLRLAEALDHLHERGLAHRDVKPSNVIFVNGRAKLADIGLVAARGQRTFVGTEGFVPPEGPGSAQADVYSLGKVLYEIATGKDRMAFPELPDSMPSGPEGKRWLELNRIICDICDPRVSKRGIASAGELAEALRRLQQGKRARRKLKPLGVWAVAFGLVGLLGWGAWSLGKGNARNPQLTATTVAPVEEPKSGILRVVSAPEGAEIFDAQGGRLGETNGYSTTLRVGDSYSFLLKKEGYRPYSLEGKVPASIAAEPLVLAAVLEIFSPPRLGEKWTDHFGTIYQPVAAAHESSSFVDRQVWDQYAKAMKRPDGVAEWLSLPQDGRPQDIILTSPKEAAGFCKWFRQGGEKAGFLTEDHEARPFFDAAFDDPALSERARQEGLKPFHLEVRLIRYGEIHLLTQPPEVDVYINPLGEPSARILAGNTGVSGDLLTIPKVKPGIWQLYFVREGYKPQTIEVQVGESSKNSQSITLAESRGVVFGKPWQNGTGMRFVPITQDLMASVWETRVQDFGRFIEETKRPALPVPSFYQTPDHPVVRVTRGDAQAFCKWLTERERKAERIAQNHFYQLPTDLEWSIMAGLKEEDGISPGWRDARKPRDYPWGGDWPPTQPVGNFADQPASKLTGIPADHTIPGYQDGYPFTAPVGSFPPNSLGLYDLSGNVQEWVADDYSKLGASKTPLGVLRGGAWNSYLPDSLLTGSRNAVPPTFQDDIYGFRVVLVKVPQETD